MTNMFLNTKMSLDNSKRYAVISANNNWYQSDQESNPNFMTNKIVTAEELHSMWSEACMRFKSAIRYEVTMYREGFGTPDATFHALLSKYLNSFNEDGVFDFDTFYTQDIKDIYRNIHIFFARYRRNQRLPKGRCNIIDDNEHAAGDNSNINVIDTLYNDADSSDEKTHEEVDTDCLLNPSYDHPYENLLSDMVSGFEFTMEFGLYNACFATFDRENYTTNLYYFQSKEIPRDISYVFIRQTDTGFDSKNAITFMDVKPDLKSLVADFLIDMKIPPFTLNGHEIRIGGHDRDFIIRRPRLAINKLKSSITELSLDKDRMCLNYTIDRVNQVIWQYYNMCR